MAHGNTPPTYRCCAEGCTTAFNRRLNSSTSVFKFPVDIERCRTWVKASGNKNLLMVPSTQLPKSFYLCKNHFRSDQFFDKSHKRLIKKALPSIFAVHPLSEDEMSCFPVSVERASEMEKIDNSKTQENVSCNCSHKRRRDELEDEDEDLAPEAKLNRPSEADSPRRPVEHTGARGRSQSPHRVTKQSLAAESGYAYCTLPETSKALVASTQRYHLLSKSLRTKLERAQRKNGTLKALAKTKNVDAISGMLVSPAAKQIMLGELRNFKRKPKGRNWTLKDKAFALGIYKRSRRAYRWLCTYLTLPSEKTLQNLLSGFSLDSGITAATLKSLKNRASSMTRKDRFCTLMFDEIALHGGLYFDKNIGIVNGFEDFGIHGRTSAIADHALVFQLQGICKKWKQPVAYFLCKDSTPTIMLKTLIKDVIRAVHSVGFTVLATVSDQGSTNRSAIARMRESCSEGQYEPVYQVDGRKIVHLFDMPHILKNVRNNFMTSSIIFDENLTAKWEHIKSLKSMEHHDLVKLTQLTNDHVYPSGKLKMNVKLAAKVLSESVSSAIHTIYSVSEGRKLSEALPTALFLKYVDLFFDLSNGPGPTDKKKPTRVNVSDVSCHHNLWRYMQAKISQWSFVREKGKSKGKKFEPPCVKGWLDNIKGFQRLWKTVKENGMKYLNLRQLNQDSLENLFSNIRQNNGSNRNPTCVQFKAALKTCIITGLSSSKIRNKNCLDDDSILLCTFKDIASSGGCTENSDTEMESSAIQPALNLQRGEQLNIPVLVPGLCKTKRLGPAYVCGYMIKRIFSAKKSDYKSCESCRSSLLAENQSFDHAFTKAKEYPHLNDLMLFCSKQQKKKCKGKSNELENGNVPAPLVQILGMSRGSDRDRLLFDASPALVNSFLGCQKEFLSSHLKHLNNPEISEQMKAVAAEHFSEWICSIHKESLCLLISGIVTSFLLKTACKRINKSMKEQSDLKRRKKLWNMKAAMQRLTKAKEVCASAEERHTLLSEDEDDLLEVDDNLIDVDDDLQPTTSSTVVGEECPSVQQISVPPTTMPCQIGSISEPSSASGFFTIPFIQPNAVARAQNAVVRPTIHLTASASTEIVTLTHSGVAPVQNLPPPVRFKASASESGCGIATTSNSGVAIYSEIQEHFSKNTLDSLTVSQLKLFLRTMGMKGWSKFKKLQLVDAVKTYFKS